MGANFAFPALLRHMNARERGAQRAKSPTPAPIWPPMHHQRAFVATPVADEEICHLVHRHGSADRAAAAIARRQLGVITVRQLELAGLGPRMRAGRVARGWLTRLHRGVYQWGAVTPPPGAIELSGCLACGPRSYASHASGAALWLLAEGGAEMAHVTVVGHHPRSRVGLRVY